MSYYIKYHNAWQRVLSTVHPDTSSLTPTGCPTVQFWQSLPGVSITSHKLKGKMPNKTALASDVPKLSELLSNWLQIQGFSQPSFMCNILLEWLTKLTENTILKWLQFYYKRYNSKPAKWKTCAEQVPRGEGRGFRASTPSPRNSDVMLPAHQCIHQPRNSSVRNLYKEFHSFHRHD